ncbi:hypothetical protein FB451DRAFT_1375685 [Mycena latifolia]|nr:hypothetical protein FB451DRAFT_1375685 [Mycena latifolia]
MSAVSSTPQSLMSFQKDRFRIFALYTRPKDVTVQRFQQGMLDLGKAWDELPLAQQNRVHREITKCLTGDTSNLAQNLGILSNTLPFDAVAIMDYESVEGHEEMLHSPEAVKLKGHFKDFVGQPNIMFSQEIMTTEKNE